jgi:signal transduction histidine kinase
MAARLRESYATLEGKVEERTIELAEALELLRVRTMELDGSVAELRDQRLQLEVVSRHKSEFLANLSHELRTPLTGIIGFSEVLLERMLGDLNERQAEYLDGILDSGRHLLALANEILDLARIEAGKLELELGACSLPEVLTNSLTMVRERARGHGISLSLQVDPAVGLVEADEQKLKQIVLNLLSNAVKFTPDRGRVELTARLADGEVRVSVQDSGIGIAAEDHARIFEEFRQIGRNSASDEGTGLGLALTKKLVELHGGRIWVESQRGVGSTFSFTLPLKPAAVRVPLLAPGA